jgi:predicted nuclease of predicted toxin-antitoxin system
MIVWITSANTSNAKMRQVLEASFAAALRLLNAGERYVQIKATE